MIDIGKIQMIGFDYYETIVRIPVEMRLETFDGIGRELGLVLPDGALGRRWLQLPRSEWPMDGPTPTFRTLRDIWTERGNVLLREFGMDDRGEVVARRYSELHAAARPSAMDAAVLNQLASRRPLAVLSDADADHLLPSIDRSGLGFDIITFSEQLRNYKPRIGTFRQLAVRSGAKPSEIVYVGDSPRADVAGARYAGMRTVWANRSAAVWPASVDRADVEIRELSELLV